MAFLKGLIKRKTGRFILIMILSLTVLFPESTYAATVSQIKAAFLYNFAYYANWPETVFKSADSPFNICMIADPDFIRLMELTVEGERVNDRPFEVKHINDKITEKYCHIVFISHSELIKNQKFLDYNSSGLLMVSDRSDFAVNGGMIEMVEQEGKIKLMVNLERVKKAGLSIRADLLNVVTIVE